MAALLAARCRKQSQTSASFETFVFKLFGHSFQSDLPRGRRNLGKAQASLRTNKRFAIYRAHRRRATV